MEEENQAQKVEELLDVDEKGNPIQKKKKRNLLHQKVPKLLHICFSYSLHVFF